MVVFALMGMRLPFRIIYGVTLLVPNASFPVSSMGKVPEQLQALLTVDQKGSPQKVPSPVHAWSSSPARQSLGASDLGDVVVGKQALLAS